MLMAHQDVVSADPGEWSYPPFEGKIVDGFILGRGTLDFKSQLLGIIEAAEILLPQGYRPERTILFGPGRDEETGGLGGPQNHAFVLHPVELSAGDEPIVTAEGLHRVLHGWRSQVQGLD